MKFPLGCFRTGLQAIAFTFALADLGHAQAAEKLKPATVQASSVGAGCKAENAVDGILSIQKKDAGRWISEVSKEPQWIEAQFAGEVLLRAVDIYSGDVKPEAIKDFVLQVPEGQGWKDVGGTAFRDNSNKNLRIRFSNPLVTDRIRLWITNPGSASQVVLREWVFWKNGDDVLPRIFVFTPDLYQGDIVKRPKFDRTKHLIFLNQSGFNSEWPKRFTAPLTAEGTPFVVTRHNDTNVLYEGSVRHEVGDFSDFRPLDTNIQYVVRIDGANLKPGVSDPFYIAPFWMQRATMEPMMRFFVDDRSIVGTVFGGLCVHPWRDCPYYAYATPSLVHLFLANPSFYLQQRVEVDWKEDFSKALDEPNDFIMNVPWAGDWGFKYDPVALAERMRVEVPAPVGTNVPDIIQLIQWGTAWWLTQPESEDHAGSSYKVHPETISELAFFLYALPWMEPYISKDFSGRVARYTFENWESAGLLKVDKTIGTFKGRDVPGWTILPNLMMHEVAKRMGRADAERYLDAAVAQAQWMVDDLDFSNPLVTKGMRMSEHKTMNGLVTLLRFYSDKAPKGLVEKLRGWSDIVIERSDDLWDYRKYDNGTNWSLPQNLPGHTGGGASWNDPGNLAGFPSSAWKVASILGDAPADRQRKKRLNELAVAQWDVLFGRNPLGAHSAWRGSEDFSGVERGWPVKFASHCAHLETVRGALCGSPATEHFPFNPEDEFRHSEGWSAFNAAFNVALAESVYRETTFAYENGKLTMHGPCFVPSIEVEITDDKGQTAKMTLMADDKGMDSFSGDYQAGGRFSVSYGHGFFGKTQSFQQ